MKIVKFAQKRREPCWGILEDKRIRTLKYPPFKRIIPAKKTIPLKSVRLLAPAQASKVVLVGLNYIDHAKELKMRKPKSPILFLKPPTALIGHGDPIIYPKGVKRLDYEAELAMVVKKKAHKIKRREAAKYILGYTCLNDVTARDLQKKDIQWTRSKSFDSFCPLGPWLETDLKPSNLRIASYLNGKIKQDSSTSRFIFKLDLLVWFISQVMTLLPGDVISTGTPPKVGKMVRGDIVEVDIQGIGRLGNTVK